MTVQNDMDTSNRHGSQPAFIPHSRKERTLEVAEKNTGSRWPDGVRFQSSLSSADVVMMWTLTIPRFPLPDRVLDLASVRSWDCC